MNTEIRVEADVSGHIGSYLVAEGEVVEEGQTLAHFIPD
ncbi:biotin/lipoyl attachment domain-containing protein [Paraburkholderia aspalathi]